MQSLKFIQSFLPDQIQKVKITSSFTDYGNVLSGVLHGSICGHLFFNIFIHDLFFDDIKIDIGNYAEDTNPNACNLKTEKVTKLLE